MLCFLCGKKIGLLRQLARSAILQYCHRKEAKLASAQAYRDEDDVDQHWVLPRQGQKERFSACQRHRRADRIDIRLPDSWQPVGGGVAASRTRTGRPRFPKFPSIPPSSASLPSRAWDAVGEVVRSQAPVSLHHEFQSGFKDWVDGELPRLDGSRRSTGLDGHVALRIVPSSHAAMWQRSASLQNYQMEFQSQMEGRSLSWAFRAADGNNYYATRLVIAKPGAPHNAGLVRYAVIDGRETAPVSCRCS